MRARDLLVVGATASIVMAAVGAVTWPLSAAIAEGEKAAVKIAQPKLELGGVVYTWEVKSTQGSEGSEHTGTLVCVNTTGEAVDTTWTLKALAAARGYPMGDVRPPLTRFDQLGAEGRKRLAAIEPLMEEVDRVAVDMMAASTAARA